MRAETIKDDLRRLVRQAPFQPFIINMENGDRIPVDHPENIAFDPRANGDRPVSHRFYVITGNLVFFGTFDAITNLATGDTGENVGEERR